VLEAGAASILQMNCGRVGGILEARKIAAMAETRQVQIAPHLYCGPVVAAANLQLALCSPNFLLLESIGRFEAPYMDAVDAGFRGEDGFVLPSREPGLGITLKDDVIAAAPYDGQALHLEMEQAPLWS
jgi:L-alanine-DL-glutamate epimerase-like enolase superfamily enzyme